jgi:hypothetical protein
LQRTAGNGAVVQLLARGGRARAALARAPAVSQGPNPDDCADLLQKIKELMYELQKRTQDLITDPLGLQWDNWNTPKIFPDGSNAGSVVGHQQQFQNKQTSLQNKIREWDDDDCTSTGLRVPQDARDLQFVRVPVPTPRPRPDQDPKPWESPGAHGVSKRAADAALGAAIGGGAGLVLGGIAGAIGGALGGTFVAPGVGTVGGGVAGAVAGAEASAPVGAAVGSVIGGAIGWLSE